MKHLLIFLALAWSTCTLANEPLRFDTPDQQRRFDVLTAELRCVVCQNQSLADSDAPLAHDLRAEIHSMLLEGLDDDEIKQFLVERYGDFVLYRPPVRGNTLILWLAPGILLVVGAAVAGFQIRRRQQQWAEESDPDDAEHTG